MNLSELDSMLDDFNKKVDDIVASAEKLSNTEIVVDDTTPQGKAKLEEIKQKLNRNSEKLTARMNGMKNKVVKNLHGIYDKGTKAMQPYKSIAEMAMALSAPGANLGALATFAVDVINTLQAIANHYVAQYTEPAQTVAAVISAGAKLGAATGKLSSLSLPTVRLTSGGTWQPEAPTPPSISIGDIVSGNETHEDPGEPIPPVKQQRQVMFTSFNALKDSPTTYLKKKDVASIYWTYDPSTDSAGNQYVKYFDRWYIWENNKWKPDGSRCYVFKDKSDLITNINNGTIKVQVGGMVLINNNASDNNYGRCLDPQAIWIIESITSINNIVTDLIYRVATSLTVHTPSEPVMVDIS